MLPLNVSPPAVIGAPNVTVPAAPPLPNTATVPSFGHTTSLAPLNHNDEAASHVPPPSTGVLVAVPLLSQLNVAPKPACAERTAAGAIASSIIRTLRESLFLFATLTEVR